MVKVKLEYGKMSCFDSSLGNFSSLVINGSKAIIEKYNSESAEQIISRIMDRMEEFIADTPRVDDVSVIILKRA